MLEENKAIVRQMVDEIQNRHNLDRLEDFFDPHFVNHLEAGEEASELNSVERTRALFGHMFTAFPDLYVTIHSQVAEGDKVVTHKTLAGTHQGEFMGTAPTGRPFAFSVIDILRLENGKIVEHWAVQDRLAMMQQLGLLPAPAH